MKQSQQQIAAILDRIAGRVFGLSSQIRKISETRPENLDRTYRLIREFFKQCITETRYSNKEELEYIMYLARHVVYKKYLSQGVRDFLLLCKEDSFIVSCKRDKTLERFLENTFEKENYKVLKEKWDRLQMINFNLSTDVSLLRLAFKKNIEKFVDLGVYTKPIRDISDSVIGEVKFK